MCDSVHRGGLWAGHASPLDQAGPPLGPGKTPPRTRQNPLGRRLQHMVIEWPVCILLECILVCCNISTFLFGRHYEKNNLDGAVAVFMDYLVAQMFDLVVWDYCWDYWILPMAVPRFISSRISALHLGIMPRYTSAMLCYIHSR